MERLGVTDDDVIENRFVSRAIEQAQFRIEGSNFDTRKYVLEYDDVMNKHRETIYRLRREVLAADNNKERILEFIYGQLRTVVYGHLSEETGEWNLEEVAEAARAMAPFPVTLHAALLQMANDGKLHPANPEELVEYLKEGAAKLYDLHEQQLGVDQVRQIERAVILRTIDDVWVDHLEAMEHLRESVRLRAYGQRDPLVEYKVEAHRMYGTLLGTVAARVADVIFKIRLTEAPRQKNIQESRPLPEGNLPGTAADEGSQGDAEPVHTDTIGRNDPCPCGSTKKYKKCGLLNTEEHQANMAKK